MSTLNSRHSTNDSVVLVEQPELRSIAATNAPGEEPHDHKPTLVSVIVPIRNERETIQRCLNSVLAQDYSKDHIEILVADGMSEDGTRALLNDYALRDSRISIFDNPGRIMVSGFNVALARSKGEVIIMLGGHTELAPDYVRNCVRILAERKADCVGGPIETIAKSDTGAAIAFAMSTKFGIGGVAFRTATNTEGYVDTVAFGAYTRQIIERGGQLDEEMVRNQDDEYNYRLRKLGARILISPAIKSRYHSRSTLSGLLSQYYQYGLWKVRVLQKHPLQMRPRQFVPPLFVLACLLALSLAPFTVVGLWTSALILGAYVTANLLSSAVAARQAGWRHMHLFPTIFATLHVSYGVGFLVGLLRFWNRWGS